MFLFLLFFQPFGVNNYNPKETITLQFFLTMLLMGIAVSALLALNELVLFPLLIKHPRRIEMITWIVWSIIWLGSGVFLLYNYLGNWHDFVWSSYFEFIGNIGVVSLIPIVGEFFYIKIKDLRVSLEEAHAYSYGKADGDHLLIFGADNLKDQLTVPLKYLVYLESEDNYIAIYHLKQETLTKTLIRKSLKSVQEEAHHPALIRCHRSFIINLVHLQQVYGNRNKLKLYLVPLKDPIPVSRQYIDDVFQLVSK